MLDLLYTVFMFLIAISLLIAIHEYGHYIVAKKLGVKILRYSIGFGHSIIKRTRGEDKTEYVLAAIPLGGYVKMLDEREGPVDEKDLHRAFNRQKLWKRFAIVFAGPLFNFLFAIFAYFLLVMIGIGGHKPIVSDIVADSPAYHAGMRGEYEILQINGRDAPVWDTVFDEMLYDFVTRSELEVVAKDQHGLTKTYRLNLSTLDVDRDIKRPFTALGFKLYRHPIAAVVGGVERGSPADKAGMQPGDLIVKIAGADITDWRHISEHVSDKAGQSIVVQVNRQGQIISFTLEPMAVEYKGKILGKLGVKPDDDLRKIPDSYLARHQAGVLDAAEYGLHRTWDMSVTTLRLLGLIVTLEMSPRNISGPVKIAEVAGDSARMGIEKFLKFLALVSISLGILNLLPIPVLDGGHLFFYLIEMVRGKPVSEKTEMIGQKIGLLLLLMLMSLAFYNDITGLFG